MTNPTPHGQVPEALRLADRLDLYATGDEHQRDTEEAAAELRRLHARIAALEAQLSSSGHALPPGIARDDTVHGEMYYTAAQVRAMLAQAAPQPAAPSERERFERHVKAYTGRDMEYHERNGTTGLEFGWTCWQVARAQPTPPAADQEPFGYFRAGPFGWTDCAESDEGAVALYEHPTPPAVVEPMTAAIGDIAAIRARSNHD